MTAVPISPLQPLRPDDLEACLALDALALGGLWTPGQWQRELEDDRRPGVGVRQRQGLLAMACGWLVVDELHITLVAVSPEERRRGLGQLVLQGLLAAGGGLRQQRRSGPLCRLRLPRGRHPSRLLPQRRRCPDPMAQARSQ